MNEPQTTWAMAAILLILGLMSAAMIAMFVLAARRQTETRQRFLERGFTPIAGSDPQWLARLRRFSPQIPATEIRLVDGYQRPIPGGVAAIFYLTRSQGRYTRRAGDPMAALSLPALDMPRITLSPRFNMPGRAGNFVSQAAQRVVDWAAAQGGLVKLPPTGAPAFDERYTVFCEDEVAAENFLTEERRMRFASLDRAYNIQCAGDCITFSAALSNSDTTARVLGMDFELALADMQRMAPWL